MKKASKSITTDGVTFKAHTINTTVLLALVNEARKMLGERPIEPRKFPLKVEDEIGQELSGKKIRLNSNRSETVEFDLTHDQALLVGMRESKAVRRSVLNKLRELETAFANPPRAGLLQTKRTNNFDLTDTLKEMRAEAGKDTTTVHYMSEAKLCNWALTGKFAAIKEADLSNEDVVLLGKIRTHEAAMLKLEIPYDERKPQLLAYAMKQRTKQLSQTL